MPVICKRFNKNVGAGNETAMSESDVRSTIMYDPIYIHSYITTSNDLLTVRRRSDQAGGLQVDFCSERMID